MKRKRLLVIAERQVHAIEWARAARIKRNQWRRLLGFFDVAGCSADRVAFVYLAVVRIPADAHSYMRMLVEEGAGTFNGDDIDGIRAWLTVDRDERGRILACDRADVFSCPMCERRSTGAELLARRFNRGLCACGAHVDRVPTLSPSPNPGAKSPGCRSLGKYPENS